MFHHRSMSVIHKTLGVVLFMGPPTMLGYLVGRLHSLDREEKAFHEGLCEGLVMSGYKVNNEKKE